MTQKIKCLDLFCCGGGASVGYASAGMEVVGVDIQDQANYPFQFVKMDALEFLRKYGDEFDFIHASPPCQGYSSHVTSRQSEFVRTMGRDEPKLIPALRSLLGSVGVPYVIENVIGARNELNATLLLCGTMFGLPIARHRLFETSFWIAQPEHQKCKGVAKRFAQSVGWEYRDMSVTGKGRRAGTSERWKKIMGIGHDLSQHQLTEAIPPAYTKYIGQEFIKSQTAICPRCKGMVVLIDGGETCEKCKLVL